MAASSGGYIGAVQVLVQCKAAVDAVSPKGRTPAMMAAWRGHDSVVEVLKDAGADFSKKDIYGHQVSDFKKKWKRQNKKKSGKGGSKGGAKGGEKGGAKGGGKGQKAKKVGESLAVPTREPDDDGFIKVKAGRR